MVDASYFDAKYFSGGGKTTAPDMIQGRLGDPVAEAIAKLLRDNFLEPGNIALEFGCGRGAVVRELRKLGVNAWGFDVSQHAVDQVPRQVYLRLGDATDNWRWLSNASKLVYSIEVLEHIPEVSVPHVFSEAYRVLQVGGYLVCSIATSDDLERVERILQEHPEQRDESHVTSKSKEWWYDAGAKEGFAPLSDRAKGLQEYLVPMTCSPYHSHIDRAPPWTPLDDSPFELYGKFKWTLLVWRKDSY